MNENDKTLIVKYIVKAATEEEIAMVRYLINTSKAHENFYVQYYETWQRSVHYNLDSIDADKAYSAFLADTVKQKRMPIKMIGFSKLLIAASILIVCALALYRYLPASINGKSDLTLSSNQITVPNGTTKKTVLPDGTKISINAGSTIKFDADFGKTSRTVYLDGEAYFDIAENKVPFIVKTNKHTIRDIGTIFNVKAYADDPEFETAVIEGEVWIEGKVSLNSQKSETVSVKKQQVLRLNYAPGVGSAEVDSNTDDLIEAKVQKVNLTQLEAYTGWTEDLLVFEGKTFPEILKIMERKYDVEIVMNDLKLNNYSYTGSFKNVDNIDKALKILNETTNIKYQKNGRIITIRENQN